MSEFDKVMSERSDFELFEIINCKKNSYKSEALLSAKKEFESRNIKKELILEFEQKIESTKEIKRQKKTQKTELEKKAMDIGKLLIPTQKDTFSKTMLSLSIFLTLSFLFYVFQNFRFLGSLFSDFGDWDLSYVEFLLPYILFPIGIYGLWKIEKHGWYLITGLLTYYAFSTIYSGIISYRNSMSGNSGIFSVLDDIFPKPSILSIIFRCIVLFGIVIFLNKTEALEKFRIQKTQGLIYLSILFLITTALWWTLI